MKRNTYLLLLSLVALYADAWVIQEHLRKSTTHVRVLGSHYAHPTKKQFLFVLNTTEVTRECTVWDPRVLLSTTGMMKPLYWKIPGDY
jgi:hypothetical protein